MTDYRLAPASEGDPESLFFRYWEVEAAPVHGGPGEGLETLTATMVSRSAEAAWPSLLELGRLAHAGTAAGPKGGRIEPVDTGNPWQVAFALPQPDGTQGLLVTCTLKKEPTAAERARRAAAMKAMRAAGAGRKDLSAFLVASVLADSNDRTAEAAYLDPSECKRADCLEVHAYGERLAGLDPLRKTADAAGQGGWSPGLVFSVRLSADHIPGVTPCDSTSDRIGGIAAPVEALLLVADALEANGLSARVKERARAVASWRYDNFSEGPSRLLAEAAQTLVWLDDGVAGPLCRAQAIEFWFDRSQADLTARAGMLAETLDMLQQAGHVSRDSLYSCNDLDDHAFVTPEGNGSGTLWLETQNGSYGIRFRRDGEGPVRSAVIARTDRGGGPHAVAESAPGFVGSFRAPAWAGPEDRQFLTQRMGRYADRTVRDFNNVLLTLETVHCCLQEELPAAPAP